ncbi:hypothetical protein BGZ65_002460 [Modicella reniformis]|uniref:Potassium channel domain-containing protein n=1 Tax=Modicella reniformis TaxID=1440133 RepID=A0A9P6SN10_9FUNG|nr:hypothetical protein BGZ65_002460 [Modicella reniformis]
MSLVTATLQDFLCVGAIIPFCIMYPPDDYEYLEGFWTMIASMVFSLAATVLMFIDLHRTPHFRLLGSGVTHKQRILIAEAMALCFYLAIGALIFIYLEQWTFLDALFFVMVTITTIGFGDHAPQSTGGRVFVIFYAAGGIVLLTLVVNSIRYVILEDLHGQQATRAKERKAKRQARILEQNDQRAFDETNQKTESAAGGGQLDSKGKPIEILDTTSMHESLGDKGQNNEHPEKSRGSRRDSIDDELRRTTLEPYQTQLVNDTPWWKRVLTFGHKPIPMTTRMSIRGEQRRAERLQVDKEIMREYRIRLWSSAVMFMIFWFIGAVIFTFVESWDFGSSMYFVVIAFTTIGYGDFVPRTLAGRSIFLCYCLLGVATLTSLASLIAEVLSKSMRKHVVETQMRRVERLIALEDERNPREEDSRDLEPGERQDLNIEDDQQNERVQVLSSLVKAGFEGSAASQAACQGSLRMLIQVSKDLDRALQDVLGLDFVSSENTQVSPPPLVTPAAIVNYLEKEEYASDNYLGPSISRDITSTSSIHRHSIHRVKHGQKYSMDSHSNTFHGTGSCAVDDGSQIKITAWPAMRADTPAYQPSKPSRGRQTASPTLVSKTTASFPAHHVNGNGTDNVSVHWQQLVAYVKQFKALTKACDEALQSVAAWEASEKGLRERRCKAYHRRKRLLQGRLRQLQQAPEAPRAALNQDRGEEETDELEEWDEEGSNDDDEDEALDQWRSGIVASLLGATRPRRRRGHSRSHHGRQPSTLRSQHGLKDQGVVSEGRRTSANHAIDRGPLQASEDLLLNASQDMAAIHVVDEVLQQSSSVADTGMSSCPGPPVGAVRST